MSLPQFELQGSGKFTVCFREYGITDFHAACEWVKNLPYGRNSNREDLSLIFSEKQGTCSSKHAVLAAVAEENGQAEIELIAGIFLMSPETHPVLTSFFEGKPYTAIPECHAYLRYQGNRYDFTDNTNSMAFIAPKIVREQRMEPHQVADWKVMIHTHYIGGWLKRNPGIDMSVEAIWADREACIALFENRN